MFSNDNSSFYFIKLMSFMLLWYVASFIVSEFVSFRFFYYELLPLHLIMIMSGTYFIVSILFGFLLDKIQIRSRKHVVLFVTLIFLIDRIYMREYVITEVDYYVVLSIVSDPIFSCFGFIIGMFLNKEKGKEK